jgi:hypothetical protein
MTTISISYNEKDHDNSLLALLSIDELEEEATGEVYLGQSRRWREWVTYWGRENWGYLHLFTLG